MIREKLTLLVMDRKKFMERFKIDTYDITDLGYLQVDTSKVALFHAQHAVGSTLRLNFHGSNFGQLKAVDVKL